MRRRNESDRLTRFAAVFVRQFGSSVLALACTYGVMTVMFAALLWPLSTRGGPFPRIDESLEEQPLSPFFYLYGSQSWPAPVYAFVVLPLISFTLPKSYLWQQFGVLIIGTLAAIR